MRRGRAMRGRHRVGGRAERALVEPMRAPEHPTRTPGTVSARRSCASSCSVGLMRTCQGRAGRLARSPLRCNRPPLPPPTTFLQCLFLPQERAVCLVYPPPGRALSLPQAGSALHLQHSNNHTRTTTNTSLERSRTRSRLTTLHSTAQVARATPQTRLYPCLPSLTPRSAVVSP